MGTLRIGSRDRLRATYEEPPSRKAIEKFEDCMAGDGVPEMVAIDKTVKPFPQWGNFADEAVRFSPHELQQRRQT